MVLDWHCTVTSLVLCLYWHPDPTLLIVYKCCTGAALVQY